MERYFAEEMAQVQDLATLKLWLLEEHQRLSTIINQLVSGHQETAYKVPNRPREGDLRRPDGANWDPASVGPGIVWFTGTEWKYLWDKKVVMNAVDDPASTDNGSKGYSVGSMVINTSAGSVYMLAGLTSSNASANWVQLG